MQAILILAHKNIDQVTKLATILNNNFEVYIHFDKKMILSFKWFIIPVFTSLISVTFDPEKTKEQ